MATRYQISLKNQSGVQVALITDWRSLTYSKRVNGVSGYSVTIDGELDTVDLFQTDGQIEIIRADLASVPAIDAYTDFEAFHRTDVRSTDGEGRSEYTSIGVSYDDLLKRRGILFRPTTSGADKSGVGETVMKQYVDQNAGPGATAGPRLFVGVFPGLTVQADGASGNAWTGSRPFRNLLEVLREIADATAVDFEIVGTGPATFEFQAQARPIGDDRSFGNTAGNAPIVFALGFGNMGVPSYSLNRNSEITAAIVLGQGQPGARVVIERTGTGIADSPWNRVESIRSANQEDTTAALDNVGDAILEKLQARETFRFDVIQTESSRYGRDYFVGDIVTARYKTIERDLQIVGVEIIVEGGRSETISITVADVT